MTAATWESIKKQPASIGLIVLALALGYWWTNYNFVTKVQASDYESALTTKVQANTDSINKQSTALALHTKITTIDTAFLRVDSLEAKVDRRRIFAIDLEAIEEAEDELALAILWRDCLLKEEKNCDEFTKQRN